MSQVSWYLYQHFYIFIILILFITSGFATKHVVIFQPNWSNNTLKSGFLPDFRKNQIPDPEFFGLKPPLDQDGANKKSLAKSVQPFWSY